MIIDAAPTRWCSIQIRRAAQDGSVQTLYIDWNHGVLTPFDLEIVESNEARREIGQWLSTRNFLVARLLNRSWREYSRNEPVDWLGHVPLGQLLRARVQGGSLICEVVVESKNISLSMSPGVAVRFDDKSLLAEHHIWGAVNNCVIEHLATNWQDLQHDGFEVDRLEEELSCLAEGDHVNIVNDPEPD
jgi:hypothetical protein